MAKNHPKTAVITGATGGLGREIAAAFLRDGMTVYALGRNFDVLRSMIESEQETKKGKAHYCKVDLNDEVQILETVKLINEEEKIDYLVHGAAFYNYGALENTDVIDLDRSYRVNVRAPYLLTQQLLPKLITAGGTIVFLNSSVVTGSGKKNLAHYASTKSALKSMADCLRQEVNSKGVRVITFILGKVATAMQKKACDYDDKAYKPGKMIQPDDAAKIIFQAVSAPESLEFTDLYVRPSVSYD